MATQKKTHKNAKDMNFKDLKQGYNLHVLDKQNMTYCVEKVQLVSMPHIDAKMTATGMVVDVTTDKMSYCMLADSEVGYPLNKVVTTDKANILREVEGIKTTSEQALSQVEHHKELVSKCCALLADLDPVQKEKQATEARFSKIEESQAEIMAMLQQIVNR